MERSPRGAGRAGPARALARVAVLAALVAIGAPAAAHAGRAPTPGATGAGDRLFPGLGNGGYDVRRYDAGPRLSQRRPSQTLPGRVRIEATATQALSRFDLDFAGPRCARSASTAAGRRSSGSARSSWSRRGDRSGTTAVRHRGGLHRPPRRSCRAVGSSVTAAHAEQRAHQIFPSNDVPSDPARFTIRARTAAGTTFVANGELAERRTKRGRTAWRYEMREPMATELIQLAFGALTVRDRGTVGGVHLRDVVADARGVRGRARAGAGRRPPPVHGGRGGPVPLPDLRDAGVDANLPFALETQTLSLFSATWFTPVAGTVLGDPRWYEPIMVHELAHQWFGDASTPGSVERRLAQRGPCHLVRVRVRPAPR